MNLIFNLRSVFFKSFYFDFKYGIKNLYIKFITTVASRIQAVVEMRETIWTKQSNWLRINASFALAIILLMSIILSFNYQLLPSLCLHIIVISFFYIFPWMDPMLHAWISEILYGIIVLIHLLWSYSKSSIFSLETLTESPFKRLYFSILIEFFKKPAWWRFIIDIRTSKWMSWLYILWILRPTSNKKLNLLLWRLSILLQPLLALIHRPVKSLSAFF